MLEQVNPGRSKMIVSPWASCELKSNSILIGETSNTLLAVGANIDNLGAPTFGNDIASYSDVGTTMPAAASQETVNKGRGVDVCPPRPPTGRAILFDASTTTTYVVLAVNCVKGVRIRDDVSGCQEAENLAWS